MQWPSFNSEGDLPIGIYEATLVEVVAKFGTANDQRQFLGTRLQDLLGELLSTGKVHRLLLFGSFVTEKERPRDLDIFVMMTDNFDESSAPKRVREILNHTFSENQLNASIFWSRRNMLWGTEAEVIADWQRKRDQGWRGIVEIKEKS